MYKRQADTHPYISTGLRKHKFGVPISIARTLYAKASATRYLKVAGVSVHIGSQITDVAPFAETVARVADLVRELRADGHQVVLDVYKRQRLESLICPIRLILRTRGSILATRDSAPGCYHRKTKWDLP